MRGPIRIAFLLAAAAIVLMALANAWLENDVHEWRHAGKCLDCHSKQRDDDGKEGWTIPPPDSHTEQFRRYTHGKTEGFNVQRCAACHEHRECKACHSTMPESHTSDFVKPRGTGMERHIMLASIRPASCLTCHESFLTQCVDCHTPAEVMPWEKQGRKEAGDRRPAR